MLKTPFHLGSLPTLLATFPGVRVVLTHRDPAQTIPSFASLNYTLAKLGSDQVDPLAVGRIWSGKMRRAIASALAERAAHRKSFLDVRYEDLIADPFAQVRRIYAFAGEELTSAAEHAMRAWSEENARDRRPVHEYTLEQFGFMKEGLRRDFAQYYELLAAKLGGETQEGV